MKGFLEIIIGIILIIVVIAFAATMIKSYNAGERPYSTLNGDYRAVE